LVDADLAPGRSLRPPVKKGLAEKLMTVGGSNALPLAALSDRLAEAVYLGLPVFREVEG
jgi:hypothetical protein